MRTCRRSSCRGLTRLEVVLLVLAFVGLVVFSFALLSLRPRDYRGHATIRCLSNLKQVGIACRLFATDHNDLFPAHVSTNDGGSREFPDSAVAHLRALSNELVAPKLVVCRTDPDREPVKSFFELRGTNVSYFVSIDANESMPGMALAGDRILSTNGQPVRTGLVDLSTLTRLGWDRPWHSSTGGGVGNVVFADGSADILTSSQLQAFAGSTNRLAIP